jgi:4-hydroxy-4-methyl-2-oxoglutarate aldolase
VRRADDGVDYGALRRVLRTALVADALDAVGLRSQCLSAGLVPLATGTLLVGRAFPVGGIRVESPPEAPYVGLLRSLDELAPDDVYVISSGDRPDVALWGELLSTAAIARGAEGAICDGFVRDVALVRRSGFRVFARGAVPYDINGRLEVVSVGTPVVIDGVSIAPGDLLVADDDGVAVVPADVRDEVVARASAKGDRESEFRTAVRRGALPSEAFARYGVL